MNAMSARGTGRLCSHLLAIWAFLLYATPVGAEMRDKKTCETFKTEHAELLKSGLRDDMTNGPRWARDNLEPERISKIKRYLELDEIIMFQCPGARKPKIQKKKKPAADAKKKTIRKKAKK